MINNNKCIYCGNDNPLIAEDSIPPSLGIFKYFPPLKNRVCITCRRKITWFDEKFSKTGSISFFRKYLGLEEFNTVEEKNFRKDKSIRRIEFTAYRPSGDYETLWVFNRFEKAVSILPQLIIIDKNGVNHQIGINENWKDSKEIFISIKNRGLDLENNKAIHFIGSNELFDRLLSDKIEIGTTENKSSRLFGNNAVAYYPVNFYFRNIVKIGFHYLLTIQSLMKGNEDMFKPVRNFIINGGTSSDFITETAIPILNDPLPVNFKKMWGHLLMFEKNGRLIQVKIQFFTGPEHNPKTFEIFLGNDNLLKYPDYRAAHYLFYYPGGKKKKFNGEAYPFNGRNFIR